MTSTSRRKNQKLIEGGNGEANYAHFALQRLNILPGELMALPSRERAFIYASIDLQIKREKEREEKLKRR